MEPNKGHIPPNQAKNFRIEAGYTLTDVAFLLGIKNFGRISEWENGLSNPGIEHLFSLGLLYHRLPDQIYYELRNRLSTKLEERKKLLQEKKKLGRRLDKGG